MYHVVCDDGKNAVIPAPSFDDKDMAIDIIRHLFRQMAVVRYVFVCEAWVLAQASDADMERIRRLGVRSHPDRQEAVIFTAEDFDWSIMAHRTIERLEGRPPCLAPLTFLPMDVAEGRMIGLLTPKGKSS